MILAGGAGIAGAATTKPSPSFVTRANAVCAAAGAKVNQLPAPTDQTALADLKASRTIITKLVSQLKAIKPPPKHAKGYAKFIASTKEQATLLGETLTAYNADQGSKITKLADEVEAITTKGNEEAAALGLTACAKNYTAGTTTTPPTTTPTTTSAPTTTTNPPAATTSTTTPDPAPAATTASGTTGSSGASGSTASSGGASQSGTQNSSGSSSGGQTVTGILDTTS
jgi:hypothetical protein